MAKSKEVMEKEVPGLVLDKVLDLHENVVWSVAWSPDGQRLVTSSFDALYIHNVIIGGTRQMHSNGRPVRSSYPSWSADGRLLAITDRKSIKVLNADDLKLAMTLPDKHGYARTIQFSPDGSLLAATYVRDLFGFVVVWDVRSGKEKVVLDKWGMNLVSIFWDEGGKLLGVIYNDRIDLYDTTRWRRTRSLDFRKTLLPLANSVVSGRYLAIPNGNTINIYDLKKALYLIQLEGHTDSINHICLSHDQRILASKSHDRTIKFWCCDKWELIASIDESANDNHVGIEICFSPNDQYFVSRTQNEKAVRIWRVDIDALLNKKETKERKKLFICYSHADNLYFKRIMIHLRPLLGNGSIEIWSDTQIEPGDKWNSEIENALKETRVAILIVSADFIASEYITQKELPALIKASATGGARIIPVFLKPANLNKFENITQYQGLTSPSTVITDLPENEQEKLFVKLSQTIEEIYTQS